MKLRITFLLTILVFLCPRLSSGQQFIGLNTTDFSAIHHMATNPAWVNNADNGMELMLFSASGLAGTNAYTFKKQFIFEGFNGRAVEDKEYYRRLDDRNKHMWANVEINGPAVSFKYKDQHHFGIFTRSRQIYRGGNLTPLNMEILGASTPAELINVPIQFEKVGFTTHSFAEVGLTYGQTLYNDYYHVFKGGVSLKYLMGFVAGSIYTESLRYTRGTDTIRAVEGDLHMNYTHNIGPFIDNNAQNDLTSWFQRAGRWGLGLDIGAQYEYHPKGTPNEPTPYLFSIAASLTDLGGIGYVADTGSGSYNIDASKVDTSKLVKLSYEGVNEYMIKLNKDTLLGRGELSEKFRVGLPTAFRLNADYNAGDKMNFAINMLLNLRGNSKSIYKPAYVSYINFTPSYGGKNFRLSLPFSVIGYQTFAVGFILRAGPFYLGSTSILGSLMSNRINNIDAYAGFVWKFHKNEYHYH